MSDQQSASDEQARACRIPFALNQPGVAAPSSSSGPAAPAAPGPSRTVNDVRMDLLRSAHNRRIAERCARIPRRRPLRSAFIAETLKCLAGEIPMPSQSMQHPQQPLFGGSFSDADFGLWRADDSLACLRMTMSEFRDQAMPPDEQRVATPYEIRQAMHANRLLEMRKLWRTRLYAEQIADEAQRRKDKAAAAASSGSPTQPQPSSSPSQSVFEEDTEDEGEEADEKEKENVAAPPPPTKDARAMSSTFVYEGLQDRLNRSIAAMRQLVHNAPDALSGDAFPSPTQSYIMCKAFSAPREQNIHRPLRVHCLKAPPRPPRREDDILAGLELFRDCKCEYVKSSEDKCSTCTPTAVMVAVEGGVF
ncbi:hypothetical protein SCUCBS95973_006084 [Sporothrix curviconia]|uniref:Uncharacterized protein n=1 Tax=Sporothrix curviconia TaxID=1260050 RepID=A0ABP0C374_9PEZI